MDNTSLDIKPQWLNIARRLQQCAACCGNAGVAILSVSVVIDTNCLPVGWTEPKVVKIDPKNKKDMIIDLLTD